MTDQSFAVIDADQMQVNLPNLNDEIVEELYRFGTLLVSDAQQRSSRLDAKLTGILGCSSAMLALLLLNRNAPQHGVVWAAYLTAIGLTVLSVVASFFGLKSKRIFAMSEADWFRDTLLEQGASTLKRYHIMSMLHAHQMQLSGNYQKSTTLRYAEILMSLAAITIFVILLISLF